MEGHGLEGGGYLHADHCVAVKWIGAPPPEMPCPASPILPPFLPSSQILPALPRSSSHLRPIFPLFPAPPFQLSLSHSGSTLPTRRGPARPGARPRHGLDRARAGLFLAVPMVFFGPLGEKVTQGGSVFGVVCVKSNPGRVCFCAVCVKSNPRRVCCSGRPKKVENCNLKK